MARVYVSEFQALRESQFDKKFALIWKWPKYSIKLLKNHFFQTRITWKGRKLFLLISCCSFSILPRWSLTFINQSILIFLLPFPTKSYPLIIICCNVSLKVNSVIFCFPQITIPSLLKFFWFFANTKCFPCNQTLWHQIEQFAYLQNNDTIEACVDEFRFFEARVNITFTLLIHSNNEVIQKNDILYWKAFVFLSQHIKLQLDSNPQPLSS